MDAQSAISLSVAEKYVDAFGKLAKEGTAVVVPGNVGDMGGMIASAMAVYGKVSEGQRKVLQTRTIEAGSSTNEDSGKSTSADARDAVLESFEKTTRSRK